MSGGARRTTLPPATDTSRPRSAGARDDGSRLTVEHEPLQQAAAARAARARLAPLGEVPQRRVEVRAHVAAMLEHVALVERRLDVERRRRRERVAAEGRGVRARLEPARDLLVGEHRADGHAAAQALRERHDVGHDALVLEGVEGARASDAGLHLVEDQHRAGLGAEPAQLLQPAGRRDDDAALRLHGLDDDGAGLVGDRAAQRGRVAEGQEANGLDERPEPGAVLRLARDGERVPIVRPWKLFSKEISSTRSGRARATA